MLCAHCAVCAACAVLQAVAVQPTLRHGYGTVLYCSHGNFEKFLNFQASYRRFADFEVMRSSYKYLHSLLSCGQFFPAVTSLDRGHFFLNFRNVIAEQPWEPISFRIVNFWNALPTNVIEADTVNSFKGRFDKHCSHLRFCTDVDDLWKKS